MGRGLPAIVSTLLSVPFVASGAYLFFYPRFENVQLLFTMPPADFRFIGLPLMTFGMFIFIFGLYFQFIANPTTPHLNKGEELIETRHPSQRVAIMRIIIGIPFLLAAGYLLFFTLIPYMYPTASLLVGLLFFSTGLKTYWANTLTTYYISSLRVIKEYRFLSLRRQEIPLDKIRGVEERKSVTEAAVGLGNLQIASGGGGGSVRIKMKNIADSSGLANVLRSLMS